MNRRSLFRRCVAPLWSIRPAERPDYFKLQLEPLEKRNLLAVYYVNDTWVDQNPGDGLNYGDSVMSHSTLDGVHAGTISGQYGVDAFGTVTNSTSSVTGQPWLDGANDGAASHLITDAIEQSAANGDTISILEGKYTESDIVIDKQLLVTGTGLSGAGLTLIVPEATSDQTGAALANFGVGTHSGIIIASDRVTVQQVMLDGSGNTSLSGTHHYHQGITTLYDQQAGADTYSALHGGTNEAPGTVAVPSLLGDDTGGNRSLPVIFIQDVRVDNTFWHGITMSARYGEQFGVSGTAAQNQIINSTVNNVGLAGQQDIDRVGILAQNLDNYPNSSPGLGAVPAGGIFQCTINNAGVGAATRILGASRNKSNVAYSTINNAVTIGVHYDQSDGEADFKGNTLNFAPGNTAVGMLYDNTSSHRLSTNTINNAFIGVKVVDSRAEGFAFLGGEGFPILGLMSVNGPGTSVAGSVGVLLTNSAAAPEASIALSFGLNVTGYETGFKAEQPFSLTGTHAISGITNRGDGVIRVTTPAANPLLTGHTVNISEIGVTELTGGISAIANNGSGKYRITTSAPHSLLVGNMVKLAGIGITELSGSIASVQADDPFGIPPNNHIRITTSAPHGLVTGNRVKITGVTGTTEANWTWDVVVRDATNFIIVRTENDYRPGEDGAEGDTSFINPYLGGGTWQSVTRLNEKPWKVGVVVDANNFDLETAPETEPWELRPGQPSVTGSTLNVAGATWTSQTKVNGKFAVSVVNSTQFDLFNDADGNGNPRLDLPTSFTNAALNLTAAKWEYPRPLIALDNPNVTGNATGYNIAGHWHVEGHANIGASIVTSGDVEMKAGNDIQPFEFYNSISNQQAPPNGNPSTWWAEPPAALDKVPMPNTVDEIKTGSLTLDPSSKLKVDINGTQAYKDIQNFNGTPFVYTLITETNPWRSGFVTPGALGLWVGNTSQSAGSLQVNSTTTELGAVFDLGSLSGTSNPIDMRGMQMLQVVAKKVPGANPDNFAIVFGDTDGGSNAYLFPTAPLNSLTYTTLTLNVLSTLVEVQECLTGLNMSAISAWAVVSDLGDSNMQASDAFGINIDAIGMVSPLANSLLSVTGTVNLGGAALNAGLNNFTPTMSQSFKIIDNDGADAVSGTFAGLSEGSLTNIGGLTFRVSYIGGTGNDVTLTRVTPVSTSVADTKLFYKGSTKWNITNGATFSDDNAIAPDKTAYIPGSGTTTFSAVSSYDKGINGLMVDISGPHGAITSSDFIFKVGNNNTPGTWATATGPTAVTTRVGSGTGGSDRIELLWANNAIQKQWLEVVVKGNDALGGSNTNTGLASSYVFLFGNALGDAGAADSSAFSVTPSDEISARNDPHGIGNPATRSNVNDFNRDGLVNSSDQIIARNNGTGLGNQLKFLVVSGSGPFAPDSSGGGSSGETGDSGVGSGLAATSSSSSSSSDSDGPGWLNLRLDSLGAAASSSSSSGAVGEALADDGDDDSGDGDDSLGDLLGEL